MPLPTSENMAYRGITSGDAGCMAYRGIVCGIIQQTWNKIVYFTVYLTRQINFKTQR